MPIETSASLSILSIAIRYEQDTVAARQRARQIARALGFESPDQTKISTAVSEIARNAFNYAGGGRVEFILEGRPPQQSLAVKVSDTGPGIRDLATILEGRYQSTTGMGLGVIGARRLMDQFDVDSIPGRGTTIWLRKRLPSRTQAVKESDVGKIAITLALERPKDAFQELQLQNGEMLAALEEIQSRQEELIRLNRELEDTNRGVVALYAELDEQAYRLKRADEMKSRFLSHMSHEFRSPLNSILALSRLLSNRANGPLSDEQDQQVGYIRMAAEDLLELVNDLLDLAKVESGKIEVQPVEFECSSMFAALRGLIRPLLGNPAVDLVFEETKDIPPLYSDEAKVSQILRNFISNALKFTERGEVRVSASVTGPNQVSFCVADTGIGIGAADQALVFQDFVQIDHPIQRRVKGTGLGLPLSKKLAKLLGGDITVQSELGEGSVFSLSVPMRFGDAPAAEAPALSEVVPHFSIPIVIVEDRQEVIEVYRNLLRDSEFALASAERTCAHPVTAEGAQPCAILLDLAERRDEDWHLLARLRDVGSARGIPILATTVSEERTRAYEAGASYCFVRPVAAADLLRELRTRTAYRTIIRVLIIDDDERARYLLKQQLLRQHAADSSPRSSFSAPISSVPMSSVSTREAFNGTDGLRMAGEEKPDIIFLDLTMPDMTGMDVLARLKEEPDIVKTPVIIVTSRILTDAERAGILQDAAGILSKQSLDQTDLGALLRRLLGNVDAGGRGQKGTE
jgi:signal transduction histidine kinase/CheY-like chemotaxis protein